MTDDDNNYLTRQDNIDILVESYLEWDLSWDDFVDGIRELYYFDDIESMLHESSYGPSNQIILRMEDFISELDWDQVNMNEDLEDVI